jgi:hypothetical protein
MRPTLRFAAFAAPALICITRGTALAGGGAATDAYEGIREVPVDVHGLTDVYFVGNFNFPQSGMNQLRAFDTRSWSPALALARLTAAHAPDPFGFRLDAGVGDLPDEYQRSDPANAAHPELSRALSYVEQAFVSATLPLGTGLRLDAGKFETPVGLEDNEALENWNYSRSLLYILAEPSYHTGLRATYRPREQVAISAYWVNGWDANVVDGNGMRAFAAAVTWNPSERLEAVVDYMGGLERAPTQLANPTLSFRQVVDGYVTFKLTERLSFASTTDYGHDQAGGGVDWWGVGGYARYLLMDWLAAAVRGEYYDDVQGFTSGTKQHIEEITTTLEARDHVGPLTVIGRLEYRRDQSDARVFVTGTPELSLHQDTLSLSALTAF